MPTSDHFDGNRFFNPGIPERRFFDLIKWQFTRQPVPWPKERSISRFTIPQKRVAGNQFSITYINHATHLIQWDNINILTDPIWSERASPFKWIGPKRVHPPGVKFEDLPPIDYILVSHNHYDHLDLPTLKKLVHRDNPKILTGLGNASWFKKEGIIEVEELDWWEGKNFPNGLEFIFTQTQHFSARSLFDRNKTLWGGFLIQLKNHSIYFAGDTAYFSVFKEINQRYGPPLLAILPIGAYEPRWFMEPVHMSAKEAVQAHLDLEAKYSLASHFGTFQLTDEGMEEPPRALKETLERSGVHPDSFWVFEPGESRFISY